MMRRLGGLALVLAVLVTASCVKQFVRVDPATVDLGPAQFQTTQPWNKIELTDTREMWTVDGIPLQIMDVIGGVKKGDRLFGSGANIKGPVFDPSMNLIEQADFIVDSLQAVDHPRVETMNIRPARIGTLDGFRFEFTGEIKNGLDWNGMVVGFVDDGKLYALIYRGTKVVYFDKMKPEVEGIFESLSTPGETA